MLKLRCLYFLSSVTGSRNGNCFTGEKAHNTSVMLSSKYRLVHRLTLLCKRNQCCRNSLILELLANVKIVNYAKKKKRNQSLLVTQASFGEEKVEGLYTPSCFFAVDLTGSKEKIMKM